MLLIKKQKGGSDFDTCLSCNVLVPRGFAKKRGNADSCFPQPAGTQTSNLCFPEAAPASQPGAFLVELCCCVLRDSWGTTEQFRPAAEQAEGTARTVKAAASL